ncbi:MAG: hypothetical protein PHU93_05215 [Candidatus Gracilibacteria bacterium]|nr:hypothetical protein [Candidatus Gracilibacteria bacterium]
MFGFEKFPKILTQEEKVDYIYDELKKDESHRRWSRIWSWMWRIFIIASTYWLYLHPETIFDMLKGATAGGNMTGIGGLGQPSIIEQLNK